MRIVIVEAETAVDKSYAALRQFRQERDAAVYVPSVIGGRVRFLLEDSVGELHVLDGRILRHPNENSPAQLITEEGSRYFIEASHYFALPEDAKCTKPGCVNCDSELTLAEALNL